MDSMDSMERPVDWATGRAAEDRGSVLPLVAMLLFAFVLAGGVVVATARHHVRSVEAQWAADAAALAAASVASESDGIAAATRLAEANGGRLIGLSVAADPALVGVGAGSVGPGVEPPSRVVVVEVELDGVRARAAAARFLVAER